MIVKVAMELSRESGLLQKKTRMKNEIYSQILKSLETLKTHKKAMHENEQFICTDCGES